MCDKVVNRFPSVLKFVPDWFVTSQMTKKDHNCLFTNEDSGNVTFFGGEIGILDVAFYEDDPETVIHVRLVMSYIFTTTQSILKRVKQKFMSAAWHPKKWRDWCLLEDKKKGNRAYFYK